MTDSARLRRSTIAATTPAFLVLAAMLALADDRPPPAVPPVESDRPWLVHRADLGESAGRTPFGILALDVPADGRRILALGDDYALHTFDAEGRRITRTQRLDRRRGEYRPGTPEIRFERQCIVGLADGRGAVVVGYTGEPIYHPEAQRSALYWLTGDDAAEAERGVPPACEIEGAPVSIRADPQDAGVCWVRTTRGGYRVTRRDGAARFERSDDAEPALIASLNPLGFRVTADRRWVLLRTGAGTELLDVRRSLRVVCTLPFDADTAAGAPSGEAIAILSRCRVADSASAFIVHSDCGTREPDLFGTGPARGEIRSTSTGDLLAATVPLDNPVAVAYSADGRRLIVAERIGSIRQFDAATGAELRSAAGHSLPVLLVAADDSGSRIVSVSEERLCSWWTDSGRMRAEILLRGETVRSVALRGDEIVAVVVHPDEAQRIVTWSAADGHEIGSVGVERSSRVVLSSDGRSAVLCTAKRIERRDLIDGTSRDLTGSPHKNDWGDALVDRTASTLLITGSRRGHVTRIAPKQLLRSEISTEQCWMDTWALSSDGRTAAHCDDGSDVEFWDTASATLIGRVAHTLAPAELLVAGPGPRAVVRTNARRLHLFEWRAGAAPIVRKMEMRAVPVCVTPLDGQVVAIGLSDGTVAVWTPALNDEK